MPAAESPWYFKAIELDEAKHRNECGSGEGVIVALLDAGVDATHPELRGRVAAACRLVGIDQDPLPIDPTANHDWAPKKKKSHGTKVAGVICGRRTGVAPGAHLVSINYSPGLTKYSNLLSGLQHAARSKGVQIVNLSSGLEGQYLPGLCRVIERLGLDGVLTVVAVGNQEDGRRLSDQPHAPGNCEAAVSVGFVRQGQQGLEVHPASVRGKLEAGGCEVPSLVAPGHDLMSCEKGNRQCRFSGSSAATAMVSGVAALILERYRLDVTELREALLASCEPLLEPAGKKPQQGQGRGLVKLRRALQRAKQIVEAKQA